MSLSKIAFRNFFINYGTRIIEFGLVFAINVLVVRGLGPESFGLYTTVMTFAGLFALLSNFGFEEVLNANIPKLSDFRERAAFLFSSILGTRIVILSSISFAVYFLAGPISVLIDTPIVEEYLRVSIPFLFFANIVSVFTFLYTGLFRFGTLATGKILLLVLQLIGVLIVFKLGWGIGGLIYVLGAVNACLLVLYFVLGYRYISFKKTEGVVLKRLFLFGLTIWLINLATFGLGKQSDIILMGVFRIAKAEIGFYQTAFSLCNTLNTLALGGFFGLSFSMFASASTKNKEVLARAWSIIVKSMVGIMAPGLFFTIIFAGPIITGLYGEAYRPAVILYQVFASFMLFARFLGGKNHMIVLYALEKQKIGFIIRLIIGLFNVAINIFLISHWGALGALIGTGLAGVLTSLTELIIVIRIAKSKYPVKFMIKLLISSVIAILPFLFIDPKSIWLVVTCGIVYYIITAITLWLFKPLDEGDVSTLQGINPKIGALATAFMKRKSGK